MSRRHTNRTLARELRAIGASKHEVAELTHAAGRLSTIKLPGLSPLARERIASRLPVDVETPQARRAPAVWALAGSFAVLLLVVGGAFVFMDGPEHHGAKHATEQAHQVTTPKPSTPDQQLQQQEQQLEQLQKQPVVNQQQLQKAKNSFQQQYEQYQKSHAGDKTFQNPWSNYQQQWWWQGSSALPKSSSSSGTLQSMSLPTGQSTPSRRH